ncbi:L-ribulose-5-phosphate 4-epimerase [Rugosimonospora africana]|uniref:L-ribulose-5-phosphate 4-epimerase n=2 Tax=Rugosimonospora africana TaxID=556532 RepID=A0A8J3VRE7_9ACTN|nr:L-ribulose-5-phosphate 4-epimerase [Rugosimonospora africana]
MTLARDVTTRVAELRRHIAALYGDLGRRGLVTWATGNASARVPDADLLVITPLGINPDDITPEGTVVADLHGNVMDAELPPSSDVESHAYVYRHMHQANGIVHTHSTYATAWAVRNESVPCVLTMMANEFGGEIPVGPFSLIGDDSVGRQIVEVLSTHRSPAVLMRNHGVYAIGATPRDAARVAVMCEEAARTVHISRQLGEPVEISRLLVNALHAHHRDISGQPPLPPPTRR